MRDKEIGHVALDVPQQVKNLRLDGHVKGADGLVKNDKGRVGSQSPRDANTLQLPAAQLVRQAFGQAGRQLHPLHERGHGLPFGTPLTAAGAIAFGDDVPYVETGIDRSHIVLKDDAARSPVPHPPVPDCLPFKQHIAAVRRFQPQDAAGKRALAAAALTQQPEDFPASRRKTDVFQDGTHCRPPAGAISLRIALPEMPDHKKWICIMQRHGFLQGHGGNRGSGQGGCRQGIGYTDVAAR